MRGDWTKRWALWVLVVAAGTLGGVASAAADGVTYGHDDGRAGWYPDQSGLTPALVSGGSFGQQFSTPVTGQVYAQPLLAAGKVLVATEANRAYALDPATGAVAWQTALGTPFDPTSFCGDLTPTIGVTGTPVVDTATNTAYMAAKVQLSGGQARYDMHALDMASGQERPGFPVVMQGAADNAPAQTFAPRIELQRPGLLLLGGRVYAAFGGHCDADNWKGWIIGVDAWRSGQTSPGTIASRWVTPASASTPGAGIWQAGSGLMSDGPGRIFAVTGNTYGGGVPSIPAPASSPPADLGESAIRLEVQSNGRTEPRNFFAPHDAANLDEWDADFAAGGPVALPASFGDATHPKLLAVAGKKGILYLLDRDALGGFKQGPSSGDLVVDASPQRGGVWSKPSVWPGDGGWLYMPTASGGQSASGSAGQFDVYRRATVSGHPALVYAASAGGSFGFGTSPPVVTSDESASGSAVVWIVYSPNGSGAGAELRAYDPIPQNGTLHLLQSWPVGTATKFTPPGVGQRKVYVGTRDGHVLGFGAPASAPLTPGSGAFPATTVGESSSRTISLHAERTVTVRSLALAGDAAFTTGTPSPALPVTLHTGDTLTVPATFSPTSAGLKGATLTATTDQEPVAVSLSGTAQAQGPLLTIDAPMIDFGGVTLGSESRRAVTLANAGGSTLHVSAVSDPGGPFSVEGIAAGQTIEPGASITAIVGFTPTATGDFGGTLRVDSDTTAPAGKDPADMGTVGLTGAGATPPELVTEPSGLDFGVLAPGTSALQSVVVRNAGGSVLTVYKSKPPSGGPFTALDRLDEGTTLQAGQSRALRIQFAPQAPGAFTGAWDITANDATGARSLTFTGTAGTASPPASAVTPSPAPATSPAAGSPPAATPARVSSVSSLKLAAWRFRTRTNLRVRATGVTRVRITLERRAGSRWVRRAGARDVRLVDGVRTVTVSARGLRAGRWRVVVAPLPNGTARHAEFFVAR